MPRYYSKRRVLRKVLRRRRQRSNLVRSRISKFVPQLHRFKRSYYKQGAVSSDPSNDTPFTVAPAISLLPNYADFTQLFDQYRIDKLKVTLYPRQNVTNGEFPSPTTDTVQSCQVFSVIDYDDGNPLSGLTAAMQYQNLKTTRGLKVHSRSWTPAVEIQAMTQGTASGTMVKFRPWLDAATPNVAHNGMKIILQNTGGFAPITYDMKIDFWLSCKQVR